VAEDRLGQFAPAQYRLYWDEPALPVAPVCAQS
jgi:hypothetical protein